MASPCLITDHEVHATLGVVDRCYILAAGQIVFDGPPEEAADDENVRSLYLGSDFRM